MKSKYLIALIFPFLSGCFLSTQDKKWDIEWDQDKISQKNQFLKKSAPLSQIKYDDKLHVIKNALGTHTYIARVQGNKLKSKNEIRIGSLFKKTPEPFLNMIVVHELAHIKEKDHNKPFYQLCQHMLPDYHQLELDLRIYLTQIDMFEDIY